MCFFTIVDSLKKKDKRRQKNKIGSQSIFLWYQQYLTARMDDIIHTAGWLLIDWLLPTNVWKSNVELDTNTDERMMNLFAAQIGTELPNGNYTGFYTIVTIDVKYEKYNRHKS